MGCSQYFSRLWEQYWWRRVPVLAWVPVSK
jgi:hypothetical protein